MVNPSRFDARIISGEFGRFLIAGAINTGITYALYLMLLGATGYLFAYSIAYAAGIVLSYFLNAFFVFRTQAVISSFVRFPFVYLIQYLLGAFLLWISVELIGTSKEIGLACSIALTIPFTYVASRFVLKGGPR